MPRRNPELPRLPNGDETKIYISRKRKIAEELGFDPDSVSPYQLGLIEERYQAELKEKALGNGLGAFTSPSWK